MYATKNGCRSGLVWASKAKNLRARLLSTPGRRDSPGLLLVYQLTRWVIAIVSSVLVPCSVIIVSCSIPFNRARTVSI